MNPLSDDLLACYELQVNSLGAWPQHMYSTIKCDLLHQIPFLTLACSPVHSHRMLLAMSVPRTEQHHEFCLWLV